MELRGTTVHHCKELIAIAKQLSVTSDISEFILIVSAAARKISAADGSDFIIREDEDCFYAGENCEQTMFEGKRFRLSDCIAGRVLQQGKPAIVADVLADQDVLLDSYKETFVRSLCIVPVGDKNCAAAIGVYRKKIYSFSEEEIAQLRTLAEIVDFSFANFKIRSSQRREIVEAERKINAYSYSVSHDLRAPLRAVSGYVTMLRESQNQNGDNETRIKDRILANTVHMADLLEALRLYFVSGQKVLKKVQIPMSVMVRQITDELLASEKHRNIHIKIGDLPDVVADDLLLRQVWFNLVANAIKYTEKKSEASIEIDFMKKSGEIIFFVRDNGVGFDMRYHDKLFQVLQRMHSQREFKGAGVGLAIVEQIISKHGGKVLAESIQGEGATFYFSLPA